VAHISHSSIRHDRHPEMCCKLAYSIHRRRLGPTNGHDLLRDADGAGSHADTESVGPGGDELCSLLACDDVARYDL
jgi:hypothetical protein